MKYVQFLKNETVWTGDSWINTGNKTHALGSDSVFILDARKSILNLIEDCNKRLEQLKNVCDYTGYEITEGSRISDNNRILYSTEKGE